MNSVVLAKLSLLLSAGLAGLGAVRLVAPPAPWDCMAVQVLVSGVLWTNCAVVNCAAESACDKDTTYIEGVQYYYCECTGGESTMQACEGLFSVFGYPPDRRCINRACPELQPCNVQVPSASWAPMCLCTAPPD